MLRLSVRARVSSDGINMATGTAIATLIVPLPDVAREGPFSLVASTSHPGSCGGGPLPRGEAVLEELRLE